MCGICGLWNYAGRDSISVPLLERMATAMSHRGPDDAGVYVDPDGKVGLGFRRLAIIDLSPAGHQPMCNETGSVWVVFNGEIYNYRSLRAELVRKGHRFHSQSDTETIVHLYEEQGVDFVNRLNGMFGVAIWDRARRRLLLARDRVGKKPLYYHDDGSRILFGSELKAILEDPTVPRDLDGAALVEYLRLGYIGSPATILRGCRKLPPGHLLVREAAALSVRRYWDWLQAFDATPIESEQACIDEIRATVDQAVRDRLVSDVPLGAFLSGGIDSSAVVASMAAASDRPVRTFSVGFADRTVSELPAARRVAEWLGTEHHEYVVEPESLSEVLPKIVAQMDEPFGDSSALPTYYVAKMARSEVTVCLSGDGGDEAFAGYDRYPQLLREMRADLVPPEIRRPACRLVASVIPPYMKGHRLAQRLALDADGRYALGMQTYLASQVKALVAPELARSVVGDAPAFVEGALVRARGLPMLSRFQYADGVTYLPEDILVKVDRTSMLNSLEVRCPLLDHRVLELAARIPPQFKIRGGETKYIFKRAMAGRLPDEILQRPKMGFGIPGSRWMKDDAAGFVADVLSSDRVRTRGVFRTKAVEQLLVSQRAGASSFVWPRIWSLLVFELWCAAYLDK